MLNKFLITKFFLILLMVTACGSNPNQLIMDTMNANSAEC